MSKISPQQYAQSLLEASQEVPQEKISNLVKTFLKVLLKKNDFKKAEKIVLILENLIKKEKGICPVELILPFPLGQEKIILVKELTRILKQKVALKERINPDLIGGFILKFDDVLIDGSIKRKLENLKQKILAQ